MSQLISETGVYLGKGLQSFLQGSLYCAQKTWENNLFLQTIFDLGHLHTHIKSDKSIKNLKKLHDSEAFYVIGDLTSFAINNHKFFMSVLEKINPWIESLTENRQIFTICGLYASSLIVASFAAWAFNHFYPKPAVESKDPLVIVDFSKSESEHLQRVLKIARVITNLALFVFNPMNPIFVFNASVEVYTIFKSTKFYWLRFKKEFQQNVWGDNGQLLASKALLTYKFLVSGFQKLNLDPCTQCSDPDDAKINFCDNHIYHIPCLTDQIVQKVKTALNRLKVKSRFVQETRHYRNGAYSHTSYNIQYRADLPHTAIPKCPECHADGLYSAFYVSLFDEQFKLHAGVTLDLVWG